MLFGSAVRLATLSVKIVVPISSDMVVQDKMKIYLKEPIFF